MSEIGEDVHEPAEQSRIEQAENYIGLFLSIKSKFLELRGWPKFPGAVVDFRDEVENLQEARKLSREVDTTST
jgi:hypothetical protein